MIAVDDAPWADAPSLRRLAHLAARIDGLPVALLLAVRDGPDEPALLGELRACPAGTRLRLGPLGRDATAALVRKRLGERADATARRAMPPPVGTRSCWNRWPPRCAGPVMTRWTGSEALGLSRSQAVLRRPGSQGRPRPGGPRRPRARSGTPPRLRARTCPTRRSLLTACARPTCWHPAGCSSSPIPSGGHLWSDPPSERALTPAQKRRSCSNAAARTPNASAYAAQRTGRQRAGNGAAARGRHRFQRPRRPGTVRPASP